MFSISISISMSPISTEGLEAVLFSTEGSKFQSSVDEVKLCQVLVKMQHRAYGNGSNGNNSSSGLLSFSKWRGQHLSMKEMEHALCEFQKYLSIEKRLASEAGKVIGQRKRKSRSNLDGDKNSHDCGKKEGPGEISLMYCDTCNNIYCTVCDIPLFETGKKADICSRCKDLDNFEWRVEPVVAAVNDADDEEGN